MCKPCILLLLVMLTLIFTTSNSAEQQTSAEFISRVDHLVYATPDLNRGIEEIEKLLGVRAMAGGQHPGAEPETPWLRSDRRPTWKFWRPTRNNRRLKCPALSGSTDSKSPGLSRGASMAVTLSG
jgi:hypothetical protein